MAELGNGAALRTYLSVLRRRKWWVIALALLGLGASLGLSLTQPKQYSATAQLLVQSAGQGINLGGALQQVTTTDVQTDEQLATSAPVVRVVRNKLGSAPPIATTEVGLDQRDRADRHRLDPGPCGPHRQHLCASLRGRRPGASPSVT